VCYFLHRCIQLRTFIHTPGTATGNKAGTEAQKVMEVTWWGTVPNCASRKQARWGEKLLNLHRFRFNSWSTQTSTES